MSNCIKQLSASAHGQRNTTYRYALVDHDADAGLIWSVGGVWSASLLSQSPTLMTGPQVDAFKVRHPNARIVDVIVYREACEVYNAGFNSVLKHSERSTPETRQAARVAGIKALVHAGYSEDALNIIDTEGSDILKERNMSKSQSTSVFNKDATIEGKAGASRYRCQMEGCTGQRMTVKWPDGKVTRPCTKGMFTRPDGAWQIG